MLQAGRKYWLEATIRLAFDYTYFIGGGGATSGFVDNFLLRDSSGRPYIPGSTLKGRLRYNAALLSGMVGEKECSFMRQQNRMCTCLVCQLFGNEGNFPGSLYFDHLYPVDAAGGELSAGDLPVALRAGVGLDRARRVAVDGHLFFTEAAAVPGVTFTGAIEGAAFGERAGKAATLLYLAAGLIRTLGNNQSRGMGWVEPQMAIKLDGRQLSPAEMEGWIKAWK